MREWIEDALSLLFLLIAGACWFVILLALA
jgi:hypothetical protein